MIAEMYACSDKAREELDGLQRWIEDTRDRLELAQ